MMCDNFTSSLWEYNTLNIANKLTKDKTILTLFKAVYTTKTLAIGYYTTTVHHIHSDKVIVQINSHFIDNKRSV